MGLCSCVYILHNVLLHTYILQYYTYYNIHICVKNNNKEGDLKLLTGMYMLVYTILYIMLVTRREGGGDRSENERCYHQGGVGSQG